MKQDILKFKLAAESLGLDIGTNELKKFLIYQKELSHWNKKINLISRKSDLPKDIFRHILDSLLIFKAIQIPFEAKILDFGSGAGFPGIPIKILRDDISLTLLESKKKKSFFLEQMIKALELKNAEVVCVRAEDLINSYKFKEKYDLATAKAMGRLIDVIPTISPFLKTEGLLVAYKGKSTKNEMKVLSQRKDFRIQDKLSFKIPAYELTRRLIVIKKIQ